MLDCMTAGGVIKRVDLDTEIKNRFEIRMKNARAYALRVYFSELIRVFGREMPDKLCF